MKKKLVFSRKITERGQNIRYQPRETESVILVAGSADGGTLPSVAAAAAFDLAFFLLRIDRRRSLVS